MNKNAKASCADCGKSCTTNVRYDDYGDPLCAKCDAEYTICTETNIRFKKKDGVLYNDKYYHISAADNWNTCEFSGLKAPDLVKVRTSEKTFHVHPSVVDQHFVKCFKTSEYISKEEAVEYDGKMFSPLGLGKYHEFIKNYHSGRDDIEFMETAAEKKLKADGINDEKDRFFGIEIEAFVSKKHQESGRSKEYAQYYAFMADKILNKEKKHCYMEWDGSIAHGYETIFMPMTKKYLREYKMRDRIWELQKMGMESFSTNVCGMHIHVNKTALDPLGWWKVNAMFARCRGKLTALTGRQQASLDQYAKIDTEGKFLVKHEAESHKAKMKKSPHNDEKYSAINFKPKQTVEFRLFNGTMNGDRFMHIVTFIDTLLDFVQSHGYSFFINSKGAEIWKVFNEFFKQKSPKSHKYLFNYVERSVKLGVED